MSSYRTLYFEALVALVLVLAAPAFLVAARDEDPVAHYTFDSGSSSTVEDMSGNGHDGTLQDANRAPGYFGDGVDLNGSSSKVVVPAGPFAFDQWNEITVMAWVRNDDGSVGETHDILSYWDYPSSRSFVLTHHRNDQYFWEIDGKGWVTGGQVSTEWTHVAGTYDGQRMRLYVDGENVATLSGLSGALPSSAAPFVIGSQANDNNYFDGVIDDVRVYSTALTQAEIVDASSSSPDPDPDPTPTPIEAEAQTVSTSANQAVAVTLTTSGGDGSPVTFEIVGAPTNGVLTGQAPNLSYSPDPDFAGVDDFVFTATQSGETSDPATVSIAVSGSGARGRVQIVDNQIRADNGWPLRGETITFADWNLDVMYSTDHWLELRDVFNLNAIRLLMSRPPQFFPDGPGYDCGPPTYRCYDLDYQINGSQTVIEVLDDMVAKAASLGMYLVIDYHPVGGYLETDALEWWGVVAARYANETHVLYELANEPVQWAANNYDAAAVAFQENVFSTIRSAAPDTHIILWTFSHMTNQMKEKVDEGTAIDYSNASVGFHPYGSYDLNGVSELLTTYPVMQTEIGGSLGTGNYHETLLYRTADHESMGVSWLWLNGAATTQNPGSPDTRIQPEEVTWNPDPGATETVDDTPPTTPTGLTVASTSASSISIEWDPSSDTGSGIAGYEVLRDGAVVGTTSVATFNDTGLSASTTYVYEVRAFDNAGLQSGWSASVAGTTEAPAPPSSVTPILHWPFEAGNGTVAADASGDGQDGTIFGATWFDDGSVVALDFGGGDYVSAADSTLAPAIPASSADAAQDFTLAAWVLINPSGDRQPIISKQGGIVNGLRRGFLFEVQSNGRLDLEIYRQENPAVMTSTTSPNPIGDGWRHVAATYRFLGDGSSRVRLYVDGAMVAERTDAVGPVQANPQPLEVGRYFWNSSYQWYSTGLIDDVKVFGEELDPSQVSDLAQ